MKDMKNEKLKPENVELKKDLEVIEECFDVEKMTVEAINVVLT